MRLRVHDNYFDIYFQQYGNLHFGSLVDWRLFKAQAMAESALNPVAVSVAGAMGVKQLTTGVGPQ
jgi:membrane-bound lytic murein transglycosylase MltF